MTILQQIERTQRELVGTKPRSRRRIELEIRLRDLRTRQLRAEMRGKRAG
jgi:hypothetical protein